MVSRSLKNIFKESFWMAIEAIRQNKLRSILTLLGISIGVFSVIGVMTAIRTLESSVQSGLNVFATNTFKGRGGTVSIAISFRNISAPTCGPFP